MIVRSGDEIASRIVKFAQAGPNGSQFLDVIYRILEMEHAKKGADASRMA